MTEETQEIRERLISIETRLDTMIQLQQSQNSKVAANAQAIDKLKIRMAYSLGFAGGLVVVWTIVTTLYRLLGAGS